MAHGLDGVDEAEGGGTDLSVDTGILDSIEGVAGGGAEFKAFRLVERNNFREREIDVIRARAGDGVARSVSEHLAGGEFESESVGVKPVLQMASAGTNGSAGNSIGTDGAVRAAGDFGRGCRDVRCKRKAGSKEEKSGKSPIAEDVRSPIAAAQVRFVDAERELIEEAAAGLVANVETGVAFFGEDILPVLRDDNVARVGGRSVIDGMGVDVGSLERNATMEAAQEAHDQRIVFGEGSGVFRVEVGARERERVDETGGADHVKARAFGAGVTEIENESERKSALCVEVPALNVRQAVVLVDGVVAKVRGVAETVVQRVEREIVGNVAVGLDIGEGRLISQILDEAAVLDHAVIDGVAGAYDGFLRSVPSQADMGRKVVAVRIDETARIFLAADGTDLVGLDRGDVRKAGVIVEGGEAIVFFDEGREVVVAETEAEGEVGKCANRRGRKDSSRFRQCTRFDRPIRFWFPAANREENPRRKSRKTRGLLLETPAVSV